MTNLAARDLLYAAARERSLAHGVKIMKNITLNNHERQELFRQRPATKQDGGFQSLLVSLRKRTNPTTGDLILTSSDLERIARYAFDYGNGGWENRLIKIFARHVGPRLGR